jgi:hypothetical protein
MKHRHGSSGWNRFTPYLFGTLIFCFFSSSCSPMVRLGESTGIAGYSYSVGTLKVLYKAGLMETWDGTMAALKEKDLRIRDSGHGLASGRIVAIDGTDKIVTISLDYRSQKETEVGIRVGYTGDRDASADIAKRIRKILFEG